MFTLVLVSKIRGKLRACYTAEFIQRCLLLEREWQVVASLQSMAALMFLFGDYDDDDGDGDCDCEGGDAESGYGEHSDDRDGGDGDGDGHDDSDDDDC